MNAEQEKELLDAVRYTANIREFTLNEISDYLGFDASEGEIREALEPHLFDLSVVEKEDESTDTEDRRTYEKIEETEINLGFDSTIPDDLESSVSQLLPKELENNEYLREAVDSLRGSYWSDAEVEYNEMDCLAYLVYHFPAYFVESKHVFSKLPLKNKIRVLDVGAGVGANALGLEDSLPSDTLVDYTALEPSSVASDFLNDLLDKTNFNFHTRINERRIEELSPEGKYDLITLFNVVNELENPKGSISTLLENLSEDGNLVVVEPAELETSVPMRELQREFHDDYTVYGPCTYMWGQKCTDRCWSFDVVEYEPPRFARRFAGDDDDYLRREVKYSYFVLRKDNTTKRSYSGNLKKEARMYDMPKHVGNRIRITVAKMSHDLGEDMFKVCDGSAQSEHYAVLRGETDYNRLLRDADYGEILTLDDVRVYYNEEDDHENIPESYHLVVDEKSSVTYALEG